MFKLFKKNNKGRKIIERSNIIQYDIMGYPLRLVMMDDGTQQWIDSYEEENDVVLAWRLIKEE